MNDIPLLSYISNQFLNPLADTPLLLRSLPLRMDCLFHHFQKAAVPGANVKWNFPVNPIPESKIVVRFWIVSILLAALTFVTLKIR